MYISEGLFAKSLNIMFLLSIQLDLYKQYYTDITFLFPKSITRFYFNFNHTTRNYLHKEYKFIKDVRTPELWTWKLWIEAWLQAVTNHNCPDELPLVNRCIWFWEEASLGFYRIYVWNNYFICAFLELRYID